MSDYTLHKIWETPPVTKSKTLIKSPFYSVSNYNYVLSIQPPKAANEPYKLIIYLQNAPATSHECLINIKLCGRKSKEFNIPYTFSASTPYCLLDNFLLNSDLKSCSRKDKLCVDFTITHSLKRTVPDFRTTTGYVGLINKSATCYMNSVLQLLFHTPSFRRLIYSIPYASDSKIPHALQRLFCLLQLSPTSVSTQELIESFGWTQRESFVEHDIQEFIRILLSNLEDKLKNTELDEKVAEIFRGTMTHYIKCINVDYQSVNQEDFYDLSVTVRGFKNLQDSLLSSVSDEFLNGDNQYNAEGFGKQDAVMGYKISQLPPVLHFHLTRFEYSPSSITGMAKVKDRFEFPMQLDMAPYVNEGCTGETRYELFSVIVHIGDSNGGHYIAYCRPTTEAKWFRFNDEYIEEVDSKIAVDSNFGGSQQVNHAYYLGYVKTSDMKWTMEKVTENDIPPELIEYFESVKNKLDPRMKTITVVNMDNAKVRVPKDSTLRDVIREVKKINPNVKDLWSTTWEKLPLELLDVKDTVENVDRVFAADFQAVKPFPTAFRVIFFFGKTAGAAEPLQDFGFLSFSHQSTIEKAMNEVKKLAGFPVSVNLVCFLIENDQLNELSPKRDIPYGQPGTLIFELAQDSNSEPKTTFKFPQRDADLLRVRDLIPEIKLDDLAHYMNYSRQCIRVVMVDCEDEQKKLKIEISAAMHLRILIKCVRKALEMSEEDAVIVYKPVEEEDVKMSQNVIVNSFATTELKQVFELKRKHSGELTVFFRKLSGVQQKDADKFAHFSFQLFNDVFEPIASVDIDMSSEKAVGDLLQVLKKRDDVPEDASLRLVLLNRFTIERIINADDKLDQYVGKELRAEIIPSDQIGLQLSDGFLLRCAFSYNQKFPPNAVVFTPFILTVLKDENFELTKCRISSLIEQDFGEMNYVLFLGKSSATRFFDCSDELVLYEAANQPDAMLYIIISVQSILNMYKKMSNQELKIYN